MTAPIPMLAETINAPLVGRIVLAPESASKTRSEYFKVPVKVRKKHRGNVIQFNRPLPQL